MALLAEHIMSAWALRHVVGDLDTTF
eukprot:SAG31_NODE_29181_length_399_cov_1.153333_1_plen_25_part_10